MPPKSIKEIVKRIKTKLKSHKPQPSTPATTFINLPRELRQKILLSSKRSILTLPFLEYVPSSPQSAQEYAMYLQEKRQELQEYYLETQEWATTLCLVNREIRNDMSHVRKVWRNEVLDLFVERNFRHLRYLWASGKFHPTGWSEAVEMVGMWEDLFLEWKEKEREWAKQWWCVENRKRRCERKTDMVGAMLYIRKRSSWSQFSLA